jgi:hypothetical protein
VWGAYNYDPTKDVARVLVELVWVKETEESLRYSVVDEGIEFAWEKAAFTIVIEAI